jgi:hypothetical protein
MNIVPTKRILDASLSNPKGGTKKGSVGAMTTVHLSDKDKNSIFDIFESASENVITY